MSFMYKFKDCLVSKAHAQGNDFQYRYFMKAVEKITFLYLGFSSRAPMVLRQTMYCLIFQSFYL